VACSPASSARLGRRCWQPGSDRVVIFPAIFIRLFFIHRCEAIGFCHHFEEQQIAAFSRLGFQMAMEF
jgi:hypothetical protein